MRAAFEKMRHDFEYLVLRPHGIAATGDGVKLRNEFIVRHRSSCEILQGWARFAVHYRDDLVVRIDEFHDAAMVEAFMRLFAAGAPPAVA